MKDFIVRYSFDGSIWAVVLVRNAVSKPSAIDALKRRAGDIPCDYLAEDPPSGDLLTTDTIDLDPEITTSVEIVAGLAHVRVRTAELGDAGALIVSVEDARAIGARLDGRLEKAARALAVAEAELEKAFNDDPRGEHGKCHELRDLAIEDVITAIKEADKAA